MKKIIKVLIIFILGFVLVGCDDYSPSYYIDQVTSKIGQEISENDAFLTSIDNKKVSYISSHPEIISEDGL